MNGVLLVDKPGGMTSHDVVQRLRRAAGQKRIGHAGTLDPMATGVLVIMLGEATKLGPYLTAADKSYLARIALGAETDTLDADGQVVRRAPIPAWWGADGGERLERALAAERARGDQIPPAFSAIKREGRAAHARARRGERVDLAPRAVAVREIRVVARDEGGFELSLRVAKGYYVRALARDLGQALGCPAHLQSLRRLASGPFDIGRARPLAELASSAAIEAALNPTALAASVALPTAVLTEPGATHARHGHKLNRLDFISAPEGEVPAAWLDAHGDLIAIGRREGDKYSILRGFG